MNRRRFRAKLLLHRLVADRLLAAIQIARPACGEPYSNLLARLQQSQKSNPVQRKHGKRTGRRPAPECDRRRQGNRQRERDRSPRAPAARPAGSDVVKVQACAPTPAAICRASAISARMYSAASFAFVSANSMPTVRPFTFGSGWHSSYPMYPS